MERHHLISNCYFNLYKILSILSLTLFLTGCGAQRNAAVRDLWGSIPGYHQVKAGETLYSIAWKYGKDYREIARLNNIKAPYKIKAGQRIRIRIARSTGRKRIVSASNLKTGFTKAKPETIRDESDVATSSIKTWLWPVQGQVIGAFASRGGMNKGIDIAAAPGAPVKATATGKVVYSGSGLRGYGELVIIKHNDEFLSAYAHNKTLFVREGQQVAAGQVIARVGNSDAKRVLLHFEIRRAGKPVDPLRYLPKTN